MATTIETATQITNDIKAAPDTKTLDKLISDQQIKNKRRNKDNSNRLTDAEKKTIFDAMNAKTVDLTKDLIDKAKDLKTIDKIFGDLYKLQFLALILTDKTKSDLMNYAVGAGQDTGVQSKLVDLLNAAKDLGGVDDAIETVEGLTNLYFNDAATAKFNANVSIRVLAIIQGQIDLATKVDDIDSKVRKNFDSTKYINFDDKLSKAIDDAITKKVNSFN